jgi:hypothetical protein
VIVSIVFSATDWVKGSAVAVGVEQRAESRGLVAGLLFGRTGRWSPWNGKSRRVWNHGGSNVHPVNECDETLGRLFAVVILAVVVIIIPVTVISIVLVAVVVIIASAAVLAFFVALSSLSTDGAADFAIGAAIAVAAELSFAVAVAAIGAIHLAISAATTASITTQPSNLRTQLLHFGPKLHHHTEQIALAGIRSAVTIATISFATGVRSAISIAAGIRTTIPFTACIRSAITFSARVRATITLATCFWPPVAFSAGVRTTITFTTFAAFVIPLSFSSLGAFALLILVIFGLRYHRPHTKRRHDREQHGRPPAGFRLQHNLRAIQYGHLISP